MSLRNKAVISKIKLLILHITSWLRSCLCKHSLEYEHNKQLLYTGPFSYDVSLVKIKATCAKCGWYTDNYCYDRRR